MICYRSGKTRSKYIETIQGCPQGDPLSPIIFNLVINPMLDHLESKKLCRVLRCGERNTDSLYMYTDDFICICNNKEDLQECINWCSKCINYFNLRANLKKSAVMKFFKKGTRDTTITHFVKMELFTWGENGPTLPNVTEYKYLGMLLDTSMCWTNTAQE